MADLDNDGDLDVGITHMFVPLSLYRNTLYDPQLSESSVKGKPHWIGFLLEGNGISCNCDAAGSRITISYHEYDRLVEQMREVTIANAFAAQGDRRALFGLGAFSGPVEVFISWCGQSPRRYGPFPVDRYHTMKQARD